MKKMKLKTLTAALEAAKYRGPALDGVEIRGISSDSRGIRPGYIFIAVRGSLSDGHRHIQDAVSRHAAAVVVSESFHFGDSVPVPFIVVKDTKAVLSQACDIFFGYPYQKVKAVGITGTNGKTTVSYLVRSIIEAAGMRSGLIGTIAHAITEGFSIESKNTTPGVVELHEMIGEMADAGDEYAVMEVSSHALDQERVRGITFNSVIFTNLTQDHLDYHKSMEEYFEAKRKLFTLYTACDSACLINKDDPYGVILLDSLKKKKFSYGLSSKADIRVDSFHLCREFSRMHVQTPAGGIEIVTPLVGRHNLYNILAALAWGVSQKFDLLSIKNGIESLKSVPGRLDRIDSKRGFSVFVDYAHTDDALKNVLESLRASLHNGRIITVFGCGGNRDRGKRPKMGKVAAALSDYVIVTTDNPRNEDAQAIADDIISGMEKKNFLVELDRFEAIKKSLLFAQKNDLVLIAGKGHETCQIVKDETLPFNDKLVVMNILKEIEPDV